jgi:hypothetical protein
MQKKPLTLTNGKEPIEARQDVNEKLKGNTAGQQAQQDDHIFNTNGHSVTPSKFDVLSRRCDYREIWERSRFTGGLDIYLRIAFYRASNGLRAKANFFQAFQYICWDEHIGKRAA